MDTFEPESGRANGLRSTRFLRAGGSAVADQVLSSGTQLLLIVLVARGSSATVLGALSVGTLVHGFFLGSVGALVGDVTLIRCRRAAIAPGESSIRPDVLDVVADHARVGFSLAVAFGCTAGVLFAAVAVLFGGPVGRMLLLFALAAPIVHGQDLLRSVAYGCGRIADAVVLDGIWMVVQVAASGALLVTHRGSARAFVLAWVGGAAVSVVYGWALGRRRRWFGAGRADARPRLLPAAREWIHVDGSRGLGFLGDFVVSTGVVQASFLAVGAVMPLAEFAAFRLAFVAVNPLANLMAGVRDLSLARLAGAHGDRRLAFDRARTIAPVFTVIAVVYALAVSLPPTRLGVDVLGHTWSSARTLVGVVALGEVFRLTGFPAIDYLKVHGTPGSLVKTRMLTSVLLVPAILVGGVVGGPRGAVWAAAVALLLATSIWWERASRLAHVAAG